MGNSDDEEEDSSGRRGLRFGRVRAFLGMAVCGLWTAVAIASEGLGVWGRVIFALAGFVGVAINVLELFDASWRQVLASLWRKVH